jgi:hypothetical protein
MAALSSIQNSVNEFVLSALDRGQQTMRETKVRVSKLEVSKR